MGYKEFIEGILSSRPNEKIEDEYMEHHHIQPKCMGGKDEDENLIWLFPEEHYIAHKLLAQENPHNKKLQYAWWNMCCCTQKGNRKYRLTEQEYADARKAYSNAAKGQKKPEGFGEKVSKGLMGHKHKEESKLKMSQSKKGKNTREQNSHATKVICVETRKIYNCIIDAAEDTGANRFNISSCCSGKMNTSGGYHWKYYKEV